MERKYNYSFAELCDRLHVCQMKENLGGNYADEISDIKHDIDMMIDEGIVIDAEIIRAIIALTQSNTAIWINEDNARKGTPENNNLWYTHQLNATRSSCKNRIQDLIGGRLDTKINYMGSIWKISWGRNVNK